MAFSMGSFMMPIAEILTDVILVMFMDSLHWFTNEKGEGYMTRTLYPYLF